ncbi:MAG: molybdenum cofactor guanylyltransferase [Bacteroidales bacterium]|nr:molybdenum cofactor guanylyltransferase [Bacteroidales bacterium]
MSENLTLSGILLAGGKSSRMGTDKAFIPYENRFLYEYSLKILENFCSEIIISSSDNRFKATQYKCYPDEQPGLGPITGLYTCLKRIKNDSALVLPCDLPFINRETVQYLIAQKGSNEITVALNHDQKAEPLVGIYSRSLLPLLEKMIREQNFKMQNLLRIASAKLISIPDVPVNAFRNINTREDLDRISTDL